MTGQTKFGGWPRSITGFPSPGRFGWPTAAEWCFGLLAIVALVSMPFIVGDQPQGAKALNNLDMLNSVSSKGDVTKQMILLVLYSGFAALLLSRVPLRMMLHVGMPLILLVCWTVASATWSINPEVTVRHTAALLGTVIAGVFLGLRFDLTRMLQLVAIASLIVLTLSLLVAFLIPLHGLDFEGRLRGVTAHKNALASFAAIAFLVGVAQLGLSGTSKLTFAAPRLILPLSLICMAWAKSTAVLPVTAAAMGTLIVGRVLRRSSGGVLAFLPFFACIAILVVGIAVEHSGAVAEMMGKDPNISGRTLVWDFATSRALERPLLGYGFGDVFWIGGKSPGAVFWSNTHLAIPHAHNGYLQLVLDAGTIGLGLFCLAVVTAIMKVVWLMRYSRNELSVWSLSVIAFFLVTNLSESWLWVGNELLPLLFIYVVVRTNINFLAAVSSRQIESRAEWDFRRCVPSDGGRL